MSVQGRAPPEKRLPRAIDPAPDYCWITGAVAHHGIPVTYRESSTMAGSSNQGSTTRGSAGLMTRARDPAFLRVEYQNSACTESVPGPAGLATAVIAISRCRRTWRSSTNARWRSGKQTNTVATMRVPCRCSRRLWPLAVSAMTAPPAFRRWRDFGVVCIAACHLPRARAALTESARRAEDGSLALSMALVRLAIIDRLDGDYGCARARLAAATRHQPAGDHLVTIVHRLEMANLARRGSIR
jgi:hypothetical protein